MILIRLAGGLGNQIFQLGAGLLLSKTSGINKIIIDDSSLGYYDSKRKNELINFFDFKKLKIQISFQRNKLTKLRIPKILSLNMPKYPFVSDKNFQTILKHPNNWMLLDGYFQRCLTQKDFDEEINILKNIFIKSNIKINEGCVIHIRGGDFISLGWNKVTSKAYYQNAITKMQNNYGQDKFYIITDDRNYSQKILENLDIEYKFIGNDIYDDFYLIGSFKYRILSSSTFALWASALSKNDSSVVIAPSDWIPNHKRKIYLPNEIRIEF